MKSYLKLVHMEVHRFRYILAALMGLTAICQIGALIWKLTDELSRVKQGQTGEYVYSSDFSGKYSFSWAIFSTQQWFALSIMLSIAALVLYVFLIWYRDWIARDTFIYRLLMLPTARRSIYLAKLTAILMFVFGMVSFQLLLLPVEKMIFNLIMPAEMREASVFIDAVLVNPAFEVLLPRNFDQFLFSYGLGVVAVLAVFAAILLERSYRRIGIFYAGIYLVLCAAAVLFPITVLGIYDADAYLYPAEIFAIWMTMIGLVSIVSIWLGFRLLTTKITV